MVGNAPSKMWQTLPAPRSWVVLRGRQLQGQDWWTMGLMSCTRCISPGCHLCGESFKCLVVSLGSLKGFFCFSGGEKSRKCNLSKTGHIGLQISGPFLRVLLLLQPYLGDQEVLTQLQIDKSRRDFTASSL